MAAKKFVRRDTTTGKFTVISGVQTSAGAGNAGDIPALDDNGKLDTSLMPTGIGPEVKVLTASENLSAGDFVNIWDDSGTPKARKADATAASGAKAADGFVLAAVTSGNPATVYLEGINDQLSGLTGGTGYYSSNATAGAAMASPGPTTTGHLSQYIGKALSATEISFEPEAGCIV